MPHQSPELARRRGSPWILAVLLLAALGAVFAYLVFREYESALARERDTLLTHARVVDENLSQQLLGASFALTGIRDDVKDLIKEGQLRQLSSRLKALSDAQPGVRTMLAIDASGKVLGASRPELIGLELGQRPYFQLAQAHPDPNTLYVSEPFKTTLDVYSLNLMKIWTNDKGRFAGVITATLDPEYFQVLLRSVLYADGTRSTLIHGSGQVLMGLPAGGTETSVDWAGVAAFSGLLGGSGGRESFFTGKANTSGDARMVALRSTQPIALRMDRPLVVTISRPVSAVLAPWHSLTILYAVTYSLVAFTGCTAMWLVQRKRLALTELRTARDREWREHAERLNMALEGGDLGLWDLDLATGTRTVNARAQEMVGCDPSSPADDIARWGARVHPDDSAVWQAVRREHQAGLTASMVFDYRIRHEDGHWVWIHSRGRVTQRDTSGLPLRMTGTYLDVTERKATDAQIKRSAELLARMSRVSRTGGWDYDLKTERSTWSPEMYRIRELDASVEPDRQIVMDAFLPESRARLAAARAAAIEHHTPWDLELQMTTAKGNLIWVRSQGEAVVEHGVTVGLTGTLKNVSWRKQSQIDLKIANEKLERMALSDGLTGIANRRLFHQTLQAEWLRCARAGQALALLMVDIDHFKLYNDHYGHAGGDQCLRRVAQTLAGCSRRGGDLISRFGGEEFAILLPAADLASACAVAQTCLDAIRRAAIIHAASPVGPWLSVSVGVASVQANAGGPAQSLLERADAALYRAKHLGRARYETLDNAAVDAAIPALPAV